MRVLVIVCGLWLLGHATACAQGPATSTVSASDSDLSEFVTAIVRTHLPHEYEKKKNWGNTTEIWDGVHLQLDRGRLKTKRKHKTVNHGRWTMYRATLTRPNEFTVTVANLRKLDDGRAAFDADFVAPLDIFARVSQWERGVQLISLSADAEARVRLQITCAVKTRLIASGGFVPDVAFEPEVIAARIVVEEFRLRRLSQLHGPLAKELGEEAHDFINDEIADRNAEIVAKINKSIAKKQDRLKLSLSDLANTKFGDLRAWVSGVEEK